LCLTTRFAPSPKPVKVSAKETPVVHWSLAVLSSEPFHGTFLALVAGQMPSIASHTSVHGSSTPLVKNPAELINKQMFCTKSKPHFLCSISQILKPVHQKIRNTQEMMIARSNLQSSLQSYHSRTKFSWFEKT
jgi:hypothetical protein